MEHKLPPKFKAAWLTALRSGQYKQGTGFLRPLENTFCCLGVACDLNGVTWQEKSIEVYSTPSGGVGFPNREDLPVGVYEVLIQPPDVDHDETYMASVSDQLIDMNDSGEHDFNSIANWIEENL